MKQIHSQMVLGAGWSSKIIALFGAGATDRGFSHVDIILPDGRLLGARSDIIIPPGGKEIPPGVQIRPQGYEKWQNRVIFSVPVSDTQYDAFYAAALSQEHKPYDHLDIVGFLVGRNWRDEDAWICSELYVWCLEQANIIPPLYLPPWKIAPGIAALVSSMVPGTKWTGNLAQPA